jgi:hypothetical protein
MTESAPEELTSWIKLVRFPPFPQVPEPLRGRALVAVTSVHLAGEGDGAAALAPLRAVADPYLDTMATVPAPALAMVAGDPQDPTPARQMGRLVDRIDDDAIAAYVEVAGPDADVPLIFLEFRHLGGALARSAPEHGALDAVSEPYLLDAIAPLMGPEMAAAIDSTFTRIQERMAPWLSERTLLNFAEQRRGRAGSFDDAGADRLAAVKDAYDPEGLILAAR